MRHRSENNKEYVQPSKKARFYLLLVIIFSLVSLFLITRYFDRLVPPISASKAEINEAITSLNSVLNYLIGISLVLSPLVSGYFLSLASRIKQSGRVPPPNFSVIKMTGVRRGKEALTAMWFCYVLAVIAWIPLLASVYIKWIFVSLI